MSALALEDPVATDNTPLLNAASPVGAADTVSSEAGMTCKTSKCLNYESSGERTKRTFKRACDQCHTQAKTNTSLHTGSTYAHPYNMTPWNNKPNTPHPSEEHQNSIEYESEKTTINLEENEKWHLI